MEKMDIYNSRLWEDLKQVFCNLYYLDGIRDRKKKIEPVYKGFLGIISVITVVTSFFETVLLIKIMTALTSLTAIIPILCPVLPATETFSTMDAYRSSLREWLTQLENLWNRDRNEIAYNEYLAVINKYAYLETKLSALFGKIDGKIEKRVNDRCEVYLSRFISSW